MTDKSTCTDGHIFEPILKRTLSGRPSRVISHYHYLNQSTNLVEKKVRIFLEELFLQIPDNNRKKVLSRLRTKDDFAFESQAFELLILRLFLQSGWNLLALENPCILGGRPDFLFENSEGQKLYVEATVAFGMSDTEKKKEKLRREILKVLDSVSSPKFWLDLKISGNPSQMPKAEPLIREINEWVKKIDKTDEFQRVKPMKKEFGGMSVTIRPMFKSNDQRTAVHTFGMERRWNLCLDYDSHLRKKLKSKFDKYKKLDAPLVIAVNNTQVSKHYDTLISTLFGTGLNSNLSTNNPNCTSGLWRQGDQWINTQVGGVILFHRLEAWNAARSTGILVKRPMAKHRLPKLNLPLGKIEWNGSGFVTERKKAMHQTLGLTKYWPEE